MIWFRRALLELWAMVVIIMVVGFLGPFGSYLDGGFLTRVSRWSLMMMGAYVMIRPVLLLCRWLEWLTHLPRFIVHGTAGSLVKSGADQQETQLVAGLRPGDPEWGADPDPLRLRDATGHERAIPAPTGAQQQFYASLAAALAGLGPPPTLPHEVLAVQQVLEAAIIASREGRTVDLPQF